MSSIAIVTDSIACVPPDLVERYGIYVVPLRIVFGMQVYRDGIDLTVEEFYHRFLEMNDHPTTSQPSTGDLLQVYTSLVGQVEDVVSIHTAASLTGGYNAAALAQKLVEGIRVHVVDSQTAGIAQGLVVLAAAQVAQAGEDAAAVLVRAQAVADRVHMFGFLDTLKYVQRGGRLNRVLALTGSLLQVRPLFRIERGQVGLLGGARTAHQAESRLVQAVVEHVGDHPVHVGITHADRLDAAQRLLEQVRQQLRCVEEPLLVPLTPAMGVHTGPGVLGLAFYED